MSVSEPVLYISFIKKSIERVASAFYAYSKDDEGEKYVSSAWGYILMM